MVSFLSVQPIFHALGDDTRLSIVGQLSDGSMRRVSDIAQAFDMSRPGVSKHLAILENADLLEMEWRGREKYYRLQPKTLEKARGWIDRHERLWNAALDDVAAFLEDEKSKESESDANS